MGILTRKVFTQPSIVYVIQSSLISNAGCGSWFSSRSFDSSIPNFSANASKTSFKRKQTNDPSKLLQNNNLIQKNKMKTSLQIEIKDYFQSSTTSSQPKHNKFDQELFDNSTMIQSQVFETIENLSKLTEDDIIGFINQLSSLCPETFDVRKICVRMDKEFLIHSTNWSKSKTLNVASTLSQIKSHVWEFQRKVYFDFQDHIVELNKVDLIRYLTVVKRFRKFPPKINLVELEILLSQILKDLTIEETGLACLAFFECNQAMRNIDLIGLISEKLIFDSQSTDEKTVGSILKIIRKSTTDSSYYAKQVLELQPKLLDRVDQWGSKVLMQLVAVNSNLMYFHLPTLERTTQKFLNCLGEARLKDLERLSMAIAIACYSSSNTNKFWNLLENELPRKSRQQEILLFPNSFISLVNYSVIANVYPEKLIEIALSEDVVESAKRFAERFAYYQSMKRELLSIHCSLKLERPLYNGPILSDEDVNVFEKLYRKPLPVAGKESCNHDAFLIQLLETVKTTLARDRNASLVYLQPHFGTPDIVLHSKNLDSDKQIAIHNDRVVIVGGSRNMYSSFTKESMGPLRMKIRQLEALGYSVITVPWFEFLPRSTKDRFSLLSRKLKRVGR